MWNASTKALLQSSELYALVSKQGASFTVEAPPTKPATS
jgi:hypothetical protein